MHDDADLPGAVGDLTAWSTWKRFVPEVIRDAPSVPGVYLFRQGGVLVYVGMAGERSGKGLRGRLTIYVSGRAPHSGLGNLALERALADPGFLHKRLTEVEEGAPRGVQAWARAAVQRADLQVAWATTETREGAAALERAVLDALADQELWNRLR